MTTKQAERKLAKIFDVSYVSISKLPKTYFDDRSKYRWAAFDLKGTAKYYDTTEAINLTELVEKIRF